MRICLIVSASLVWVLCAIGTAWGQGVLYTLRTNGPPANRLNFVILAEGYTNGQTAKFTNEARAVFQQFINTPPYSEYASYFNAYAIFVESAQDGSDHPSTGIFRDTYFNSTFDTSGIQRLVTINSTGFSRVTALLASLRPDYDLVLLLVNDPVYGGSGGFPTIASTHASSAEIAIHELGHGFAHLGDEYTSPYPGFPDDEEPNTTRETNRAQIKWNAWILPTTPVPTPDTSLYSSVVGLFEGAHYHTTGWFRPKRDCKMRSLGVPFCEVCRETLVKSIYDLVDPMDGFSPQINPVSITNAGSVTLSVTLLRPLNHQIAVQWFVNTVPRAGATNPALTLAAWELPQTFNAVRVDVTDATPFVRNDPQRLLFGSRSWTVRSTLVPPLLAIRRTNNLVSITWPPTAAGFMLQSRPNLDPATAWATALVISNQTSAEFTVTDPASYFRLKLP